VRRREFIALVGCAAAYPRTARAQQLAKPVVGFLHYASPDTLAHVVEAFRQGLKETGYIEGHNVTIEYRWADGHYDRLPALAIDLAHRHVTVIAACGTFTAQVAKRTTSTIPIVFTSGADPVASGLVRSMNRPEANLTGTSGVVAEIMAKRLELTRDLLPHARVVAMLINPDFPGADSQMAEVQAAGQHIGLQTERMVASSEHDLGTAFAAIRGRVDAVVVGADGFFLSRRDLIVTLAAHYAMPAIYPFVDYVTAGGLISYGAGIIGSYRQAGIYTGKILKGAKPADLPVIEPTTFELVINLKTAKALGITIPPTLLPRADEVIE